MYSMEDLLHVLHSDGLDALRLRVGSPPVLVLDGDPNVVEGPALAPEDAQDLWHALADTRQRRTLREKGEVEFLYRFRDRVSFVVKAKLDGENILLDIH
jgi:Tfp pilus assembly pilus retraction ATPase PilT